jgi:hypothetical protein
MHGPRIGLRPLVLSALTPRLLAIGHHFGALAFFEVFYALWMSTDGTRTSHIGFAFTWDSTLPH